MYPLTAASVDINDKDHGSFLAVWADLSQGVMCTFAAEDHVRLCSEVG